MKKNLRKFFPGEAGYSSTSFLILLLVATLCGCSTGYHRAYTGRTRPKDQVAMLVVPKQAFPGHPDFRGDSAPAGNSFSRWP